MYRRNRVCFRYIIVNTEHKVITWIIIIIIIIIIIYCKKTAVLGTAHILQKVLMLRYRTYLKGEITLHVAQTVNTEQLQNYVP